MLLLLAIAAPLLPGCFWFTSARAGEELRTDVDSLRIDVDTMRESLNVERDRFAGLVEQAQRQVERLEAVIQRTTDFLTRNSADFGVELDDIRDDLRAIRGRMDELSAAVRQASSASATHTRRLDRLERAAGLDPEIDADEAPATADDLYAKAQELLVQEDYGVARAYLRLFVSRYAGDPRFPRARIDVGVSYAMEGRHSEALGELSRIAREYGTHADADRIYYYSGLAAFGLGRCDEARTLLREFQRKFPQSALKPAADQLLEQTRTAPQCRR
jgi:TolA-binding protein